MEWIFFTLAAVVIVALVLGMTRRKPHGRQTVPGQFDFDQFKTRELSRRGVHDKTQWK